MEARVGIGRLRPDFWSKVANVDGLFQHYSRVLLHYKSLAICAVSRVGVVSIDVTELNVDLNPCQPHAGLPESAQWAKQHQDLWDQEELTEKEASTTA